MTIAYTNDHDDGRPIEILSKPPSDPSGEPNIIRLKTYLTINEHDRWFAEYLAMHRDNGTVREIQYNGLVFKYMVHSWSGPLFQGVKSATDLPYRGLVLAAINRAVELFGDRDDEPEQPDPK